MRITIFLLLISTTTFSQIKIETLGSVYPLTQTDEPILQFERIDTTWGVVVYPVKGEQLMRATRSFKVDSVFLRRTERPYHCNAFGPNVSCLVFHAPVIEFVEERKTVAIITEYGKRLDLSKSYTFIPDSQIQEP